MEAGMRNATRFLILILCGIAIVLSLWALTETRRLREESKSRLEVHLIEERMAPHGVEPASLRAAEEAREHQKEIFEVTAHSLPTMLR